VSEGLMEPTAGACALSPERVRVPGRSPCAARRALAGHAPEPPARRGGGDVGEGAHGRGKVADPSALDRWRTRLPRKGGVSVCPRDRPSPDRPPGVTASLPR